MRRTSNVLGRQRRSGPLEQQHAQQNFVVVQRAMKGVVESERAFDALHAGVEHASKTLHRIGAHRETSRSTKIDAFDQNRAPKDRRQDRPRVRTDLRLNEVTQRLLVATCSRGKDLVARITHAPLLHPEMHVAHCRSRA